MNLNSVSRIGSYSQERYASIFILTLLIKELLETKYHTSRVLARPFIIQI